MAIHRNMIGKHLLKLGRPSTPVPCPRFYPSPMGGQNPVLVRNRPPMLRPLAHYFANLQIRWIPPQSPKFGELPVVTPPNFGDGGPRHRLGQRRCGVNRQTMSPHPIASSLWSPHVGHLVFGAGFSLLLATPGLAQVTAPTDISVPPASTQLCPTPALARVQSHRVQAGETLGAIAAAYDLLPATVIAMNPSLTGGVSPGQTLRLPPFNGLEVAVPAGSTWADLAALYAIRADVLFEINGCGATPPARIFIPGVPGLAGGGSGLPNPAGVANPLSRYPLEAIAPIVLSFGWQPHPTEDRLVFNSGVTLAAPPGAAILAAGAGTVAYVGPHETLGTLVVINHDQGVQTRYGYVTGVTVAAGERVTAGTAIAQTPTDGPTDAPAYLYFEVRTNSDLGWVARNPGDYLPDLAIR